MKIKGHLEFNENGSGQIKSVFIERLDEMPDGEIDSSERGRLYFVKERNRFVYYDGDDMLTLLTDIDGDGGGDGGMPIDIPMTIDDDFWVAEEAGDVHIPTHYITDADAGKHYNIYGWYENTGNPNDLLNATAAEFIIDNGEISEEFSFRVTNRSNTPIRLHDVDGRKNAFFIEPDMSVELITRPGEGWGLRLIILEEANFNPGFQFRVAEGIETPGNGQIIIGDGDEGGYLTIYASLRPLQLDNSSSASLENIFSSSTGGMLFVQSVSDHRAQAWYRIAKATIEDSTYAALVCRIIYSVEELWQDTDRVNILLVPDVYQTNTVTVANGSSSTLVLDLTNGKNFRVLLTNDITEVNVLNPPYADTIGEIDIEFTQDSTGGHSVTFPASFKALGQSDISVSLAPDSVTVLSAKTFDGITWRYALQESS